MSTGAFCDTIFALSSGALPAGVAVIRLSGPQSGKVLSDVGGCLPPEREMRFCRFRDADGEALDHGYGLWLPGPRSFTGEDCAELHLHGGRAVVAAVLRRLGGFPSLRLADAGEFTRRAFVNGKIDLVGSEALGDLISAETEAQRRFALRNGTGRNRELYAGWRQKLIAARAMIEAEFDFSDESDIPDAVSASAWPLVEGVVGDIRRHIASFHVAEIIRDGFRVALIGPPNVGKSSLINALARRDIAIVSDEPGTTRDVIEVAIDIHGNKVVFSDTAGIREAPGKVERLGIERSLAAAKDADLVLLLREAGGPVPAIDLAGIESKTLEVKAKADLDTGASTGGLAISALTGKGIDELIEHVGRRASESLRRSHDAIPFNLRHVGELKAGLAGLERALDCGPLELRAEELRSASDALGRIIGAVGAEELLDVIFSRFCIGK